ncbi:MAG: triose-phosphate isomerase [Candidatus Dormibacteria bacterium]
MVAGNWKMHTTVPEALNLTAAVRQRLIPDPLAEVVLLPPYISLWAVQQLLIQEPRISVGAQDCYWEPSGAYTGQVSAAMLRPSCQHVLVGHSERRHLFGDTDEVVRRKLDAALAVGLRPLLAVGETAAERDAAQTETVLSEQIRSGLGGLDRPDLDSCTVAYEPVWAIGRGESAELSDISRALAWVRAALEDLGSGLGSELRVLYGGSVSAAAAPEILRLPEVDGALVGGASLDPDEFCAIVAAAGASVS